MYKKLIKQLFPYLKPYKNMAIGAFVLSFVLAGLSGAQIKLVKPIFDKGLSGQSSFNQFLLLAAALLAIGLLNFPARFFHFYWLRFVGEKINNDIQISS